MKHLKWSQIEAEILVCPYCMNRVYRDDAGCCGESPAHFENAYVCENETYLESEVIITSEANYENK